MNITKSKKGIYKARVYIGRDENNRPVQKVFSDPDKAKLRLKISQYLDEHRGDVNRRTFSAAMKTFIDMKTPVLSPSTIREYAGYKKIFEERYPSFCSLPLMDIRQSHVQDIVNDLVEKKKSPKTIRNHIGFVSAVLSTANYRMPKVTLPQMIHPDYNIPSEATMKAVMKAAAGTDLEIPIALAVFGLRRGEICGLSIDDIQGNMVHIHRSVVLDKDKKIVEKTTKTSDSDRYIQIPPSLARKIRSQGYVVDYSPDILTHRFIRFLEDKKIEKFRFHDLRHFFVSYCHNVLHLSDAQIQHLGGWKTSYVMRSRYLQVMNEKQSAMLVANKMAKIIG